MQTYHDINAETLRLTNLLSDYPAGCDPEFDADHEELERQFAELRLHFGNQ
jgi:hypothetical protein